MSLQQQLPEGAFHPVVYTLERLALEYRHRFEAFNRRATEPAPEICGGAGGDHNRVGRLSAGAQGIAPEAEMSSVLALRNWKASTGWPVPHFFHEHAEV